VADPVFLEPWGLMLLQPTPAISRTYDSTAPFALVNLVIDSSKVDLSIWWPALLPPGQKLIRWPLKVVPHTVAFRDQVGVCAHPAQP